MTLHERIAAFAQLGKIIETMASGEREKLTQDAAQQNPWFTSANVTLALQGVTFYLKPTELERWATSYPSAGASIRTIGVVMAGNIPLVGFHDFLCVLMSGNRLKGRLSSKDSILLPYLADKLVEIESRFSGYIEWADRLNGIDAVIATGSDNSARYFEYYFRSKPRIIRKNRSSCAVLSGKESSAALEALGLDIFSFFGLGCRNVSQLYVPVSFDFTNMVNAWSRFSTVIHHSKYANNYDYQKAIFLVNKIPFLDTGFVLLKEDSSLVSPISVLHFSNYADSIDLQQKLLANADAMQCIVSEGGWVPGSADFGRAQFPAVTEYADGVDTVRWITSFSIS